MCNKLNWNKDEKGYTLAGVLLIFLIVSVLGMSIVALSVNAMKISTKQHDNQSTYYIAESGANYKIAQLEILLEEVTEDIEDYLLANPGFAAGAAPGLVDEKIIADKFFTDLEAAFVSFGDSYDKFERIKGHEPIANPILLNFDTSVDDFTRKYLLTSTGNIDSEQRTVQIPLEIKWHGKPKYALLTKEQINLGTGCAAEECGGITVNGDIGVVDPIHGANSITLPSGLNNPVTGDIFTKESAGGNLEDYVTNNYNEEKNIEFIPEDTDIPVLPDFPTYPTYPLYNNENGDIEDYLDGTITEPFELNSNMSFGEFHSTKGITFDLKGADREVVIDSFNFRNTPLNIIDSNPPASGSHNLTMYVKDEFQLEGQYMGDESNIDMLNIYYAGTDPIILIAGGVSSIYGSIYAEKADFRFGAGVEVLGNILTGGDELVFHGGMGGSAQIILAPNANIDHQDGLLRGVVVSKSYIPMSCSTLPHPYISESCSPEAAPGTGTGYLEYTEVDYGDGPLSLKGILELPENAGNSFLNRLIPYPKLGKQTEINN